MIQANLAAVQKSIERAALRAGRNPKEITLVAVTKKVSAERIAEALSCGVRDIAESYVQEALLKVPQVRAKSSAQCHMIGHLQTNKVGKAVEIFDVIQSVDSLKLLGFINRKAAELGKIQKCFVEIKVSGENTKTGLPEADLDKFLEEADKYKSVQIGGIMTMAPFFDSQEDARPYFKKARKIFEKLGLEHLSMGMSGDYEVAVEEGSTMVRIGRAIFGER